LIVDILLPRRSEKPPLSRWHYLISIACIFLLYALNFFWGEFGVPSVESVLLMLCIIGFFVALLIWWVKTTENRKQEVISTTKSRKAKIQKCPGRFLTVCF
jgi:hypothetical protein